MIFTKLDRAQAEIDAERILGILLALGTREGKGNPSAMSRLVALEAGMDKLLQSQAALDKAMVNRLCGVAERIESLSEKLRILDVFVTNNAKNAYDIAKETQRFLVSIDDGVGSCMERLPVQRSNGKPAKKVRK